MVDFDFNELCGVIRRGADSAIEAAALVALNLLNQRHAALFGGDGVPETGKHTEGYLHGSGALQVLHPGYGERRPIPPGYRVKVSYFEYVPLGSRAFEDLEAYSSALAGGSRKSGGRCACYDSVLPIISDHWCMKLHDYSYASCRSEHSREALESSCVGRLALCRLAALFAAHLSRLLNHMLGCYCRPLNIFFLLHTVQSYPRWHNLTDFS